MIRLLTLLLCMFFSIALLAQSLDSHQWKDRILLVLTSDPNSEAYQQQLSVWKKDLDGLAERKLVIYHLQPDQYGLATPSEKVEPLSWEPGSTLYEQLAGAGTSFRVILIGLDGTVKLKQDRVLTLETLFGTIDSMPMRRRELKRKNDGN